VLLQVLIIPAASGVTGLFMSRADLPAPVVFVLAMAVRGSSS